MNKTDRIRQIYAIVIGVTVVALGIALICVAADIYYSGRGTGVVFTREIVSERLKTLAIPFILLIGAIAVGAIFPLYEVRAKHSPEATAKLLASRLPNSGSDENYTAAKTNYTELGSKRFDLWFGISAVLLCCTIAVLCYMLNTANFMSADITQEIFDMVKHVLPWIALGFATLIIAVIQSGVYATQRVKAMKEMIKHGDGKKSAPVRQSGITTMAKRIVSSDITLWVVRGIVFVVAVTFIIVGIINGGAHDVLIKAINICTECIGLG